MQTWTDRTAETATMTLASVTFADVPTSRITELHVEAWMKAMMRPGPKRERGLGKMRIPTPEQVGAALREAPDGFHGFVCLRRPAIGGGGGGCDVVTVQHALGHSSASITLNVYSHLWPKAEDRTRAAAANLMAATAVPADSGRFLSVTQR